MICVSALVRGAYGAALCCAPGPLAGLAGGPADGRTRAVARVLGARHLAQAVLTAVQPGPALLATGAEVDVLHSASMMALAAVDAPRRRIGLADGLVAAAFAADGIRATRRAAAGDGARPGTARPGWFIQRRDAAAGRLAAVTIPRALRPWLTGR